MIGVFKGGGALGGAHPLDSVKFWSLSIGAKRINGCGHAILGGYFNS